MPENTRLTPALKTPGLIFIFYKTFMLPALIITGCCLMICYEFGLGALFPSLILKLLTLGIIFFFINDYKRNEFYYYHNLGVSKTTLWVAALAFDFLLWLFLTILICSLA